MDKFLLLMDWDRMPLLVLSVSLQHKTKALTAICTLP